MSRAMSGDRASQSRDREGALAETPTRPQVGVDRLKPVPPMQANDLPLVAQAVSPAYRIFSQLLRERCVPVAEVAR
jgi:hypothetical protein